MTSDHHADEDILLHTANLRPVELIGRSSCCAHAVAPFMFHVSGHCS
jgi:hypothetical protein